MGMAIRMAGQKDLPDIVKLLKKGKLNVEGLGDHLANFMVIEHVDSKQIVGTAGLETFDERYGLLRSLAVDSELGEAKVGLQLVRILLAYATQKELDEIYLLTRSAPFFHLYGFEEVEWGNIPEQVKKSIHFQQASQGFSTAMVWKSSNN